MRSYLVILGMVSALAGCGYQSVEPGHRALRFAPNEGGLKPEVLQPGKHSLGWCFLRDCGRLEDYDVTFQTQKETIFTPSSEGLAMDVKAAIIFRPIVSELYQLHAEIGPHYYEEIVAPEFRSACRSILARHSYTTLVSQLGKVEDEMEEEVRRRIKGRHIEIANITLEQVKYSSPEIAAAVEKRLVGQQEAVRQKAAIEAEAARKKMQLELEAQQAKLKAETEAEQARLKAQLEMEQSKAQSEAELLKKKNEKLVLQEQLQIEKLEAEVKATRAKGEAQTRIHLAHAKGEENRAETMAVTPLTVQQAGYEALGKLGGHGTTIFLGDWSRAPQFLWPRAYGGAMPAAPAAPPPVAPSTFKPTWDTSAPPVIKGAAF